MTHDELVDLRDKMQELQEIFDDQVIYEQETGCCCYMREDRSVFDLEKTKHILPLPEYQYVHDLIVEVNEMTAQYIRHYEKFPSEICEQ